MRAADRVLEADLLVRTSSGPQFEVILESSGSGKKNGVVTHRNPDYKEALETLLRRITLIASRLDDCLVDSTRVHNLGLDEHGRRVVPASPFAYPVALEKETDFHRLRLALTTPQTTVGSHVRRQGETQPSESCSSSQDVMRRSHSRTLSWPWRQRGSGPTRRAAGTSR